MSLILEVTWPLRTDIHLDFLPACERALNCRKATKARLVEQDGKLRVCGVFDANKRVPDTDSFRITSTNGAISLSKRLETQGEGGSRSKSLYNTSPLPFDATLVVILESPHRCEFGDCFKPLAPARGPTGIRLENRLIKLIESEPELKLGISSYLKVRVVLCNPIQFQTSLHVIHENHLCEYCRDFLKRKVWRALWGQGEIRFDFLERLKKLNPEWILNACVREGDLNWEVSSFLASNLPNADLYETVHPIGWTENWKPWCKKVI